MSFFFQRAQFASSDEDDSDESSLHGSGSESGSARGSGSQESSEDNSEEESELSEDESEEDESEEESEEEEEKTAIRSASDKRVDEMNACLRRIENCLKIDDWSTTNNEFDKLARLATRIPGQQPGTFPIDPAYFKAIRAISDALTAGSDNKKKLNATNAKSLNTMKQRTKKAQRDYTEGWESFIKDPEAYERNIAPAPVVQPPKVKKEKIQPGEEAEDLDDFQTVGKSGKSLVFTPENIFKTLEAILEQRGRKNTDRVELIKTLEKLLAVAESTYSKIRVRLVLTSSLFDYSGSNYMPTDSWNVARQQIQALLETLLADKQYIVQEKEMTSDYNEMEERAPSGPDDVVEIRGSIWNLVDRLDEEFTRSLRELDPQAPEYIDRLRDEKSLYAIIVYAQAYFERAKLSDNLQRTVLRRLEHVYSKPGPVIRALENAAPSLESQVWSRTGDENHEEIVPALCDFLCQPDTNARLKIRAILSRIFYYALRDEFYKARDMLLRSHIATVIYNADVDTQILYNRTVAQLGLAAFRNGLIDETETILRDLYANSAVVRERLAQGIQQRRSGDVQISVEQERLLQARQLPFHLHINTDLLECAYLVSAMLTEIAQITFEASDPERKRETRSRTFRRMLDSFERQAFIGPPENKREYITQAAKVLQQGDWQKATELIHSIKTWSLLPNEAFVKDILTNKIKIEGLRTYLFAHASFYTTISLSYLASTFDLPLHLVKSIVSIMIWNEQLTGSLDQASGLLLLSRLERTPLQQMAIALADKASQLLNENERAAQLKLGDTDQKLDNLRDRESGGGQRRGANERRHGGKGSRGGRGARGFQAPLGRSLQQNA